MSHDRAQTHIAWNGRIRPAGEVSVDARGDGWLYGLGCFETMGLAGGRVRFAEDHRKRLRGAAAALGLAWPAGWEAFMSAVAELVRLDSCADGVARLSFHAGPERVDWMARVSPAGLMAGDAPLSVGFSRFPHGGPSPLSRWKHNNYAANILAFREARSAGRDEDLLCRGGRVVEGCLSTLWAVRGGAILTPPLEEGALAGVVRARLLRAGTANGLPVREQALTRGEILSADSLYLSNAAMLVRPVGVLDGALRPADADGAAALRAAVTGGADG
ncbi:MAG: aminotransferase class IV [Puniceicoccaceae bacterium]